MNFKFKKIISIILLIIVISVMYYFRPIKFAINEKNIDTTRNYILVKLQKERIFCTTDHTRQYMGIIGIVGNVQMITNLNSDARDDLNVFVFYGNYINKNTLDENVKIEGLYYEDTDSIFYVEDWDILYPIKRQDDGKTLRINPKSFLKKGDFEKQVKN